MVESRTDRLIVGPDDSCQCIESHIEMYSQQQAMQKKYPALVFFVLVLLTVLITVNVLADTGGQCSGTNCTGTLDSSGYAADHSDCAITGGQWNSSTRICDVSAQTCTGNGGTWDPQAGQCDLPLVAGTQAVSPANQACIDNGGYVDLTTGRCVMPTTVTPKSAFPDMIPLGAVGISGAFILRRRRE
jgi:hypothetical protein